MQRSSNVLPPPLEKISVPTYLTPSGMWHVRKCGLSVMHRMSEEERLPPTPLAVLGSVLHEAGAVFGESVSDTDFASIFAARLSERENDLAARLDTSFMVPLREAVGRLEWNKRVSSFSKRSSSSLRRARVPLRGTSIGNSTGALPTGFEVRLSAPGLCLSGTVDKIQRSRSGYLLTEYKTGKIADKDGYPLQRHIKQLHLYALMVEDLSPNVRVELRLVGDTSFDLVWGETERRATRELLRDTIAGLPLGTVEPARRFANPGEWCASCRIRHRCSRYLDIAAAWWNKTSVTNPVAPFDSWGTVERTGTDGDGRRRLVILDAAGRKVDVARLRTRSVLDQLDKGDRVYLFGLQPTEALPHHGSFRHPRNFHDERQPLFGARRTV